MYICNTLTQIRFLPQEATWGVQILKAEKKKNQKQTKNTACPNKVCPQLLCMILCRTSREMVGF